jgi:geranylgeranyl pyrophosphate synthase
MSLSNSIRIDHAIQKSSEISLWISSRLYEATADAPAALREISKAHLAIEGKRLRGRMAFQAASLFGADFDAAITWAAAVELMHDASLVHDDLCDGDAERRGQQTVFKQHGEALAVCLGDYYISTAFRLAAMANPKTVVMLCDAVTKSTGGQASEFNMSGYPSWARYCEIAVQKTAPLLSLPITGAAILTGYAVDQQRVESYFANAATCFQIINDLHNFLASQSNNELCSDLANCRPNALIACFRDSLNAPMQARFDQWSDRIRTAKVSCNSPESLQWWQFVRQSQSLAYTAQRLQFHFNTASSELNRLPSEIQSVLSKFHQWLDSELTDTNVAVLIRKDLNS